MIDFLCNNFGIILNLVGTIFIAISFGPYPDKNSAPYTSDNNDKKNLLLILIILVCFI